MKNIVIVGAGDLGKEIVWLIEDINKRKPTYLILGFLDDEIAKNQKEFYGYKVLGPVNRLDELTVPFSGVMAFQDGSVRRKIAESHTKVENWETIIHPTAVIADSSKIGEGSIFFPQTTVSVDSQLGKFGLYYIHSTVCNDCSVGNYVSVMTGAAILEHAKVGDGCFLAAGSCVYPHRQVGKEVKVGVEATVSRDCGDGAEVNEKGSGFFLFK